MVKFNTQQYTLNIRRRKEGGRKGEVGRKRQKGRGGKGREERWKKGKEA